MPRYEYRVVPAPAKGEKSKGVKTAEGRFALTVEAVLNDMGASGWEYQRAELLPSEERSGLTGTVTNWRNVLVFRRSLDADAQQDDPAPRVLDAPGAPAPATVAAPGVIDDTPHRTPPLRATRQADAPSDADNRDDGPDDEARAVSRALRDPG